MSDEGSAEDKLGFIMFECGLEGVALKIVKKSQFEHVECKLDVKEATVDATKLPEESESEAAKSCNVTPRLNDKTKQDTPKSTPKDGAGDATDHSKGDWENVNDAKTTNNAVLAKDSGNVSSCIIELKVVWFNFAAPPRAPITRKIDYTRLDWNLLSTASPAINAWMNPSNRLAIRVVHMVRTMYRRSTATVACLMAEALDTQKAHMLIKVCRTRYLVCFNQIFFILSVIIAFFSLLIQKLHFFQSRYDKLTPLAQTLQEDPSLQLCSILQQYYLETDPAIIENNLRESELPQLFTLRQVDIYYVSKIKSN